MGKSALTSFSVVFFILAFLWDLNEGCVFNFTAIGREPSNEFVWTLGEDIGVSVNFYLTESYCQYGTYIYWESSDGSESDILQPRHNGSHATTLSFQLPGFSHTVESNMNWYRINLTITNTTEEMNGSILVVQGITTFYDKSQEIRIKFCKLGPELTPLLESDRDRQFVYNESTQVTCNSGQNGIRPFQDFVPYSLATCGRQAKWEIGQCIPHCNVSDLNLKKLKLRNSTLSSPNYKTGTNLELSCREGVMTSENSNSYVIEYVVVTCQQCVWKSDATNCWKGQYIDIFAKTSSTMQVAANKETLIICKISSGKTSLEFRGKVAESQTSSTKTYVTLTSRDQGEKIVCRRTNNNGAEESKELTLDVLFSPETNSTTKLIYALSPGTEGHVIIPFRSNPVISRSDVKVQHRGNEISNFYLKVEQLDHYVIIDFTRIQESDFGDYVITVTSYQPRNSSLEIKAEITRLTTTWDDQQGNVQSATNIIIILAIFLVTSLLVNIFLALGWKFNFKISKIRSTLNPKKSHKRSGGGVTNDDNVGRELPHYEDITDPAVGVAITQSEQSQMEQESGYINMAMPKHRTSRPSCSYDVSKKAKYNSNAGADVINEANYEEMN